MTENLRGTAIATMSEDNIKVKSPTELNPSLTKQSTPKSNVSNTTIDPNEGNPQEILQESCPNKNIERGDILNQIATGEQAAILNAKTTEAENEKGGRINGSQGNEKAACGPIVPSQPIQPENPPTQGIPSSQTADWVADMNEKNVNDKSKDHSPNQKEKKQKKKKGNNNQSTHVLGLVINCDIIT